MKRILGLAALLGHALTASTGIQPWRIAPGGRGANKRPVRNPFTYKGMAPEYSRYWHDMSDPVQAERFAAAELKRQRKAEKLQRDAATATNNNWAHGVGKRGVHLSPAPEFSGRLNPFYVAK